MDTQERELSLVLGTTAQTRTQSSCSDVNKPLGSLLMRSVSQDSRHRNGTFYKTDPPGARWLMHALDRTNGHLPSVSPTERQGQGEGIYERAQVRRREEVGN
jgi:hypothetical protein